MKRLTLLVALAIWALGPSVGISQRSPGWTYAIQADGNGVGWRNPILTEHPFVIETVMKLVPPRQVDGDQVHWAQFHVSLDCNAQTYTRLSGRFSNANGAVVREIGPQPPAPFSDGAEAAEAGRVVCNEAPFPSARSASSLEDVARAFGATRPVLRPMISGGPSSAMGGQVAAALSNQGSPERWVYVAADGGGFGWREPSAGSIPSTVEVISRTSAPIMIAEREARWSYYTVRLNCAAQTTTVTSHVITTETGERIADVPEGPKPINSDTPPQAAGMVICNRAEFPGSRVAGSREAMIAALRGAGPSSDAPAPGATDRPGSTAGSRAPSEVSPPLRSAAANESLGLPTETTNAFRAAAAVLVPPMTVWETDYMRPEETLYALAPDAPNAAFYRSVSRSAGYGRHEMWVVAVLRAVSTDPAGAYDLGASLYSIDCEARTTQVLRGRVYRDMAPARDTPIEPVQPLQPGTVAHQMIIQVCDGAPAPAVAGTLAEVRRRVPLG